MKDELEKVRLADRTEGILRGDRKELLTQRQTEQPATLLTRLPETYERKTKTG